MHTIVSYDQNISQIILEKMDSMSDCDVRLVFTLQPKDSTLQYKKYIHLWNNFPCISTMIIKIHWVDCSVIIVIQYNYACYILDS